MNTALSLTDVLVLLAYIAVVFGMSALFARRQHTGTDYFLASRRMRGTTLALSVVANQVSAVSLVGAPAFVAMREGGGLRWLQYELALPLAMLLLIVFLLPTLRGVPAWSIYAYGEQRFGPATRRALASVFVLSRGLALGVVLYASSLVVAEAIGSPLVPTLIVVGGLSVAYTSLGGLAADIWSDVLQLAILWIGTLVSAAFVLYRAGPDVLAAVPSDRMATFVVSASGVGDGSTFALWPMLFGGLFLYLAYYGCDQSQAQRLLAARDLGAARHALLLNGLLRFPLVLTYCVFGLLLTGLLRTDDAFAALMANRPADSLVPIFITSYLPSGLRGLFIAAILAAAMSSIDSAMNSLAAVTLEDVLRHPAGRTPVWISRLTSLAWGVVAVGAGVVFAFSDALVLETVNQIGSAFYGPVLGVFLLGVFAPRVTERGALVGLAVGLLGNLALARFGAGISWLWWNPFGFFVSVLAALVWTRAGIVLPAVVWPRRHTTMLVAAFCLIVLIMVAIPLAWTSSGDAR